MDPNANGLRDGAIADLAAADTGDADLTVWGEAIDVDALLALPKLESLEIYKLRRRDIGRIARLGDLSLRRLSLRFWPEADLTLLPFPRGLTQFTVWQSKKLVALDGIERAADLTDVTLSDNGKLRSVEPLAGLPALRGLSLSGGIWNKQELSTLDGLEKLTGLRHCQLRTVDGRNVDLAPVARLPNLESLDLWARDYPMAEVAKVAAAFPFFHEALLDLPDYPYRDGNGICSGCNATRKQMFLRGRRFLWCVTCDAKGLNTLLADFDAAVEAARPEYGRP